MFSTVHLWAPRLKRRGIAFGPPDLLYTRTQEQLDEDLDAQFFEEDDRERFEHLGRALSQPTIRVLTYRGETEPAELHVYLRAPGSSWVEIFAFVLAGTEVIEAMVSTGGVVMETASFQSMGPGDTIESAVEDWIRRVWLREDIPKIEVET